jgi:hypothetical protein
MIYFIQDEGVFLIKIGFTAKFDVEERRRVLQTGSPVGLRLLAVIPGDKTLERSLHTEFAFARAHGEWFHPHPEIIQFIIGTTPPEQAEKLVAERDAIIVGLMDNLRGALSIIADAGRGKKVTKQLVMQRLTEKGLSVLTEVADALPPA